MACSAHTMAGWVPGYHIDTLPVRVSNERVRSLIMIAQPVYERAVVATCRMESDKMFLDSTALSHDRQYRYVTDTSYL